METKCRDTKKDDPSPDYVLCFQATYNMSLAEGQTLYLI